MTGLKKRITAAVFILASSLGLACAQVSVLPGEVPPDTNQALTVRVQNALKEPTVKVRVEFPAGLNVSGFQPKPGWSREVERDGQKRITAATWSGGQIGEGEFEDFMFLAHTPKENGELSFKSYQTYQNGATIEWVNPRGQERPAPFVEVRAGTGGRAGSPASTPDGVQVAPATGAGDAAPAGFKDLPGAVGLALVMGAGGLLLGLVSLALSSVSLVRRARAW